MRSLFFSSTRLSVNNHRVFAESDRLTSSSTCASASLCNVLRTPFQVQTSRFNSPSLTAHAQAVTVKTPSASSSPHVFSTPIPASSFYPNKTQEETNTTPSTLDPVNTDVIPSKQPTFPHHWSSQHLPQALQVVHEILMSHGKGSW